MVLKHVVDTVRLVDPDFPAPDANGCAAAKERCLARAAAASIACHRRADRGGGSVDATCLLEATEALAAADRGCFARAESAHPCGTTGDVGAAAALVDAFVTTVVSAGAGCPPTAIAPGDHVRSLVHGGLSRNYHLHVPPGYDSGRATPLVVALHGGLQPATDLLAQTDLPAKSDAADFLLVAPEGYSAIFVWNAGGCCPPASTVSIDDVGFIADVIQAVAEETCIDWRRIYLTGLSNGAGMSYRLACELSDRVAAIAPVAAGMFDVDLNHSPPVVAFDCLPVRPVPVLHMHGLADTCFPFAGGFSSVAPFLLPAIPDTIAKWVALNGCAPATTVTYQNGAATCVTHDMCAAGADVTLCTVEGLGHLWPGYPTYPAASCGGGVVTDLVANDALWDFFTAHPIP